MGAAHFEEAGPGIRRLLARNPSPFTFTGTQTYVVGTGEVAVIDPGPDDPAHVEALLSALGDERVAMILVTHSHRDHSPASRLLAQASGAPIVGCPPLSPPSENGPTDEAFDPDYRPDVVLAHGGRAAGRDWTIEAVATPGHTSNHLCFAYLEGKALFTGDHVMGWSTSIISPPDGDMGAYMQSLQKLLARGEETYFPTHGPAITDPPTHVQALIDHRLRREAQIIAQLQKGKGTIPAMVRRIYTDTDPALYPAAELSVLAHLIDLERRGRVAREGENWMMVP